MVPVYNTAKFLPCCLDSLLDQDLDNAQYEIVCVNDGSSDDSCEVLMEYAKQYRNIKVINQKNAGHAAARNRGFNEAQGKYIWFVDSDDCIDKCCYHFLISTMEKNMVDVMTIRRVPFYSEKEIPKEKKNYQIEQKKGKCPNSCSGVRIFSRKLLLENGIVWNEELSPCDDIAFVFLAQSNANSVLHNESVSYYHRQWNGSVTAQKSQAASEKYISSFYLLAEMYDEELKKSKYSKVEKKQIEERKNQCTQAILMEFALRRDKEETNRELIRLKEKGMYPYKTIYDNLKPKVSLKRTMMDFAQFFFFNEKYYLFFCSLIRIIK